MLLADYLAEQKKTRGNKYHAIKESYKGVVYDSKKEMRYARLLDTLRGATDPKERVASWERQVPYVLSVNGHTICKYIADFVVTFEDGRVEVQDVKSAYTKKLQVYRLKKKLMLAVHGIEVIEV